MYGKVAVLIGSESDRETMEAARQYFDYFKIEMDLRVMSAHRNPEKVSQFDQKSCASAMIFEDSERNQS